MVYPWITVVVSTLPCSQPANPATPVRSKPRMRQRSCPSIEPRGCIYRFWVIASAWKIFVFVCSWCAIIRLADTSHSLTNRLQTITHDSRHEWVDEFMNWLDLRGFTFMNGREFINEEWCAYPFWFGIHHIRHIDVCMYAPCLANWTMNMRITDVKYFGQIQTMYTIIAPQIDSGAKSKPIGMLIMVYVVSCNVTQVRGNTGVLCFTDRST